MSNTAKKIANTSVVMPSFQSGPILLYAIKSVLDQDSVLELILIDNGNCEYTRGKIAQIAKKDERLVIVSGQGNIGFSRACNIGARRAKGEYLLNITPDCTLPQNAINKAIRELKKHPKAWVAGVKLINKNGREQEGNRRNLLNFTNMISQWFSLYKYFSIPCVELHKFPVLKEYPYVPAISGAFMLMKRSVYDEVGGMDKDFFLQTADMDFCLRIHEMGGKILFVNDVNVRYYGKSSDVSGFFLDKCKAQGLVKYFNKNFKGAYFPGSLLLINLFIYLRMFSNILRRIIKSAPNIENYINKNDAKLKDFLLTYKQFEDKTKNKKRDDKYILSSQSPVLITDVRNPVGLCILRRLLAANINIVALYKDKPIDIYHPKLTWLKENDPGFELEMHNEKIKSAIITSNLWDAPPNLDILVKNGLKRLISFSYIENTGDKELAKKILLAEKDIARICLKKAIKYTMLKPSLIYGLGMEDIVSGIYKYIKLFGILPKNPKTKGVCQPVHADDLSIAAIKIININETHGKTYNLCGEEVFTYYEMICKIVEKAGLKQKPKIFRFLPFIFNSGEISKVNRNISKKRTSGYRYDNNAAIKDFDYSARPFLSDGIGDLEG